mmetsp:Transcript_3853/g.8095  ORF Transcript_3853/g.8095 Transcript_3853/m.8095 type:complete len:273 (+) Transcript_3853:51-869(+)
MIVSAFVPAAAVQFFISGHLFPSLQHVSLRPPLPALRFVDYLAGCAAHALPAHALAAVHRSDAHTEGSVERPHRMTPLVRFVGASCATIFLLAGPTAFPSWADTGFDGTSRLLPCPRESNCVSSNYSEPPNSYISPLVTARDRDVAFGAAVRDMQRLQQDSSPRQQSVTVQEVMPKNYYIHLTVPGTAPGSLDDVEFIFGEEGTVARRGSARVRTPPPPFCIKRNCINGSMDQRVRLDRLTLGLPPADQDLMRSSVWTPIFFNSDRVPGFDE